MSCPLLDSAYSKKARNSDIVEIKMPAFGADYRGDTAYFTLTAVQALFGDWFNLTTYRNFLREDENILKIFGDRATYEIVRQLIIGSRVSTSLQIARVTAIDYDDYIRAARMILTDDWHRTRIVMRLNDTSDIEYLDLPLESIDHAAQIWWSADVPEPFDGLVKYRIGSQMGSKDDMYRMPDGKLQALTAYKTETFTLIAYTNKYGLDVVSNHFSMGRSSIIEEGVVEYTPDIVTRFQEMIDSQYLLTNTAAAQRDRDSQKMFLIKQRGKGASVGYFSNSRYAVQIGTRSYISGHTDRMTSCRLLYPHEKVLTNRVDFT